MHSSRSERDGGGVPVRRFNDLEEQEDSGTRTSGVHPTSMLKVLAV